MKRSKKIKDMSVYEASEFWNEHDFSEFVDVKEIRVSLKKKKYLGMDSNLYSRIKNKAQKLKRDEDTLIDEWLREKVRI